ncbi:MAG: GTP cyclohydrolase I, partial [Paludibacter sp.]
MNGFLKTETAKPKMNGGHLLRNNDNNRHDFIGDNHVATSLETPMREDAFLLNDEQKMVLIEDKFRDIMNVLGLDLTDDSLNGTPHRVAKMFVKEIFYGLNPENKPNISVFENKFKYGEML